MTARRINKLAKESKDVINFRIREEAKNFINNPVVKEFFAKASGKAHNFKATKLKNGEYLLELEKTEFSS